MSAIRKSARGETCTIRIPGRCNGDPETTVLCHAPHPDKGMGIKGPDTWAAYGCSACHDVADGRVKGYMAIERWFYAIRETQRRLIEKGLMPK